MGFVIGHKLGTTLAIDNYLLLGEAVNEELLRAINEGAYDYLLPLREVRGDLKDELQDVTVQLRCEVRKLNPIANHLKTVRHHDYFIDLVVQMIDLMERLRNDKMSLENLFFSRDGHNMFLDAEGQLKAIYWPLTNTRIENDPWDFFYILPYMMTNEALAADRFYSLYWSRIQQYRHLDFTTQRLLSVLKESSSTLNHGEFLPRKIQAEAPAPAPRVQAQPVMSAEPQETAPLMDSVAYTEGTVILSAEELGLTSTVPQGAGAEINSTMPLSFMNGGDAGSFMSGTLLLDQENLSGTMPTGTSSADDDVPYFGATVLLDE